MKRAVFLSAIGLLVAGSLTAMPLETVRIDTQNAPTAFRLADIDGDSRVDVVVLQGGMLHLLCSANGYRSESLPTPPGILWIDVARVGQEATRTVAAVGGETAYRLANAGTDPEWTPLFDFPETVGDSTADPAFVPLLATVGGAPAILVRRATDLLAFDFAGEPLPVSEPLAQETPYGLEFSHRAWLTPPRRPDELAYEVEALRPPDIDTGRSEITTRRFDPPRILHAMEARFEAAEQWPWMPLTLSENFIERVYFCYDPPAFQRTRVRIRKPRAEPRPGESAGPQMFPERIYPGRAVITRVPLVDFNNDGYRDLVTWAAPDPGRSVAKLMRSVNDRAWPVQIGIRLYDTQRESFAPQTAAVIETRLPIEWFLEGPSGEPLRNLAIRDLNRDGHHDLAMSLTPTVYAVWLWDNGFRQAPDFVTETESPHALVFPPGVPDIDPNLPIVLRSARALTILPPMAPQP